MTRPTKQMLEGASTAKRKDDFSERLTINLDADLLGKLKRLASTDVGTVSLAEVVRSLIRQAPERTGATAEARKR